MDKNIIDEIKSLNQALIKRLFFTKKNNKFNKMPRPLQMAVLEYIIDQKKEIVCQKDLEAYFGISKSAISDVIKAMKKNNMIEILAAEADARKKIIVPTRESIERYEEIKNEKQKDNEELLKCLTKEEIDEFFRLTEKLKNHMKEGI